ncbi:MAG: glutaminyl-peptide cyclotransferase, partial [Eudoraea sp.]|nr:glutaminyl-peptide cyclotransferase [Eudoraea sp.]
MNFIKFFILNGLALFFMACGGENNPDKLFEIQLEGNQTDFQQGDTISVSLANKKGISIETVRYSLDCTNIPVSNENLVLNVQKLGIKTLQAHIGYEEQEVTITKDIKVLAPTPPALYTYEIINEYPHDIKAFTQGLEFYNDTLYE